MRNRKTIEAVLERKEIEANLNLNRNIGADIYKATGDKNYEHLVNLPTINGVTVIGDKISHDYALADEGTDLSLLDVQNLFNGSFY